MPPQQLPGSDHVRYEIRGSMLQTLVEQRLDSVKHPLKGKSVAKLCLVDNGRGENCPVDRCRLARRDRNRIIRDDLTKSVLDAPAPSLQPRLLTRRPPEPH